MRQALEMALEALEYHTAQTRPIHQTNEAITAIKEALAQPEQEPVFIKHHGDDEGWSEWVCPDPNGYLMKCCDCGLVHEAEFGVVRYKSETDRKDCDMVDDPNLQSVFRMRRSEEWTPEDTAHRAGGLPMAQPEQEPVALKLGECWPENVMQMWDYYRKEIANGNTGSEPRDWFESLAEMRLVDTTPPQRKPLTDEEMKKIWYAMQNIMGWYSFQEIARAIEAAHGIKE